MQLLDLLLGGCYSAEHLGTANLNAAKEALRKQLVPGSVMEKEARERMINLDQVKDRCYISKKHLEYIRYGLVQ